MKHWTLYVCLVGGFMEDKLLSFTTPNNQVIIVDYELESKKDVESLCQEFFTSDIYLTENGWRTEWMDIETQNKAPTEITMDDEFEEWVLQRSPKFREYYVNFPLCAPIKREGDEVCIVM